MKLFLRCDTKQEMLAALLLAGILVEVEVLGDEGEAPSTRIEPARGYTVPFIGEIRRPTGETRPVEMDGEMFDEPVYQTVPGYHANVLGELTEEQKSVLPIIPRPDSPVCDFWS